MCRKYRSSIKIRSNWKFT